MSWAQGCKTMLMGWTTPPGTPSPSYVSGLMHEMDRPCLRIAVLDSQWSTEQFETNLKDENKLWINIYRARDGVNEYIYIIKWVSTWNGYLRMTDRDLGWPKEYIAICFIDVPKPNCELKMLISVN